MVALAADDVIELPFAAGEVIAGKYRVIGLIGVGGMGYVVSAEHIELGELVALKFLRREAMANEELVERFAREARAAARIKSEHVARVYDVGTLPDGVPFIVMEHLQGQDLSDLLHAQGALPIPRAVEYIMHACEALASAHVSGVVHRDIKPENLFVTRRQGVEVLKILDFGISKVNLAGVLPGADRRRVKTMMAMGSPVYMSPEQIRAAEDVDARSDIWSLGCVLFELLTGVTPFDAPSIMQLGAAILEAEPAPLRAFLPDAPAELEQVLMTCLQKDPADRYQSIAELAIALYPFAPKRARIFAERCSQLIESDDLSCADLTTIKPPPHSSGTQRIEESDPVITTSAPAAAPVYTYPKPRSRGPLKIAGFLALACAAGAASLTLWQRTRAPDPVVAVTTTGPATATPAPVVAAPAPVVEQPAAQATAAGASAVASASAAPARSSSGSVSRSRARVAPVKTRAPRSQSSASEEPDVGF